MDSVKETSPMQFDFNDSLSTLGTISANDNNLLFTLSLLQDQTLPQNASEAQLDFDASLSTLGAAQQSDVLTSRFDINHHLTDSVLRMTNFIDLKAFGESSFLAEGNDSGVLDLADLIMNDQDLPQESSRTIFKDLTNPFGSKAPNFLSSDDPALRGMPKLKNELGSNFIRSGVNKKFWDSAPRRESTALFRDLNSGEADISFDLLSSDMNELLAKDDNDLLRSVIKVANLSTKTTSKELPFATAKQTKTPTVNTSTPKTSNIVPQLLLQRHTPQRFRTPLSPMQRNTSSTAQRVTVTTSAELQPHNANEACEDFGQDDEDVVFFGTPKPKEKELSENIQFSLKGQKTPRIAATQRRANTPEQAILKAKRNIPRTSGGITNSSTVDIPKTNVTDEESETPATPTRISIAKRDLSAKLLATNPAHNEHCLPVNLKLATAHNLAAEALQATRLKTPTYSSNLVAAAMELLAKKRAPGKASETSPSGKAEISMNVAEPAQVQSPTVARALELIAQRSPTKRRPHSMVENVPSMNTTSVLPSSPTHRRAVSAVIVPPISPLKSQQDRSDKNTSLTQPPERGFVFSEKISNNNSNQDTPKTPTKLRMPSKAQNSFKSVLPDKHVGAITSRPVETPVVPLGQINTNITKAPSSLRKVPLSRIEDTVMQFSDVRSPRPISHSSTIDSTRKNLPSRSRSVVPPGSPLRKPGHPKRKSELEDGHDNGRMKKSFTEDVPNMKLPSVKLPIAKNTRPTTLNSSPQAAGDSQVPSRKVASKGKVESHLPQPSMIARKSTNSRNKPSPSTTLSSRIRLPIQISNLMPKARTSSLSTSAISPTRKNISTAATLPVASLSPVINQKAKILSRFGH